MNIEYIWPKYIEMDALSLSWQLAKKRQTNKIDEMEEIENNKF